jgi:hypothetical protein
MADRQNNTTDTKQQEPISLVYNTKLPNMVVPAFINATGHVGQLQLVAQPVNGMRNKAYGLHPQFLVDGNLSQKSFYLKENPATMVLAPQVSTANSGQTVSRTIQSSQIMKSATLKTNHQPLQTKNILLNKSASPTQSGNNGGVPPTQVRNADGSAREGTTPMHSALGTTTGTPQTTTTTRQIIQSTNQQNNQPTHLVYDAHARPQQIIRSNIIQNKHPITIHQTMPQSAGQQVIYYAGNPHGGAQALFQFASGQPRIIQQVMTSSDNNNYQQKFPFCVVPHPQTPTQASHVTSSHGTPIATVATTTATVAQHQHHQQQQQLNEFSQRVPILNRKRPTQTQNGVILTHQRSPTTTLTTQQPTISSNSSNENRVDQTQSGQPPAKQPKLDQDSSNSVHIKVAAQSAGSGGSIKYESSPSNELTNQNTNRPIIRSPSRGSRRKQILDSSLVFSPVTSGSPSQHQQQHNHHNQQQQSQPQQPTPPTQKPNSTPTPDKLIDEASTDEAEECEDEPNPKMKMQLENPNYPLPPYRKVSKINQTNNARNNGTTDRADSIKPPRAIRTPKQRPLPSSTTTNKSSSSSVSHNKDESSGKQNTRIYMNGYDFKAERSSTLHFMCSDDVKYDSGHIFDPKLNLKQLKDNSRCCFYKLNLLNKELSSCQANQRHLQEQFQRRKHKILKSERLRELYSNIELRNRLLVTDLNESNAASSRLVLHYNKLDESSSKPDRKDIPLLKKLLKKAKLKK